MTTLPRSPSLRVRLLILSVVATALVLAIGGAIFLAVLRSTLIQATDDGAIDTAETLAAQAKRGRLPYELVANEEVSTAAQVVFDELVISSTTNALGDPPMAHAPQPVGQLKMLDAAHLPYDKPGPFRIAALGAKTPQGPVTIYVAVDAEDVGDVVRDAAKIGIVGASATLTALALLLWFVIGFTLRPVTAIRQRADDISGRGLHLRVPVPTTHDEISSLASTINSMLDRIEESVRRQDAFVADAAHELRTPLATLRTRLDVALLHQTPPDDVVLQNLLADVERMGELVDQLLLLARSDATLLSTRFEPVDVDDLAVRAAAAFDHPTIRLSLNDVVPTQVSGNLALLEQVLPNLLANAARFASARIDVGVQANNGTVVLTVDDDGPGIAATDRTRVFDRFVRLDEARGRETGGTGLGLSIVDQIIRMHGGHVEAQSSPLGGARIRIELPRRRD